MSENKEEEHDFPEEEHDFPEEEQDFAEEGDPFGDDPFGENSQESEDGIEGAPANAVPVLDVDDENFIPPPPGGRKDAAGTEGVRNPYVGDTDVQYEVSNRFVKPRYANEPMQPGPVDPKEEEEMRAKQKRDGFGWCICLAACCACLSFVGLQ